MPLSLLIETSRLVCECPSHGNDRRSREQTTTHQPTPVARHVSEPILDYPASLHWPGEWLSLVKPKFQPPKS